MQATNRTNLELKPVREGKMAPAELATNRTNLELKLQAIGFV